MAVAAWLPILVIAILALLFLITGSERSLPASAPTVGEHLDRARALAIERISRMPKGTMVVFDFDDTLFDPKVVLGHAHGHRETVFDRRRAIPLYRPIRQMCDVLRYATDAGMYVTLITARPDTMATKQVVLKNFEAQRLTLHEYHANAHYPELRNFKAELRARISKFRPIGLTIGDQWTDVNDATYDFIKLPTRRDPALVTSLRAQPTPGARR